MKAVLSIWLLSPWVFIIPQGYAQDISGTVFHDSNLNGAREPSESGLAGVFVSNGQEVVETDEHGRYQIDYGHSTFVFVIKPSGYRVQVDDFGIPISYQLARESEAIDFGLIPQEEPDTFKVAMLGDLQMRNQEEVQYANRLLTPEIYKRDDLSFTVMLGDIADDSLDILENTRQITKHFGIPSYAVFGNHDRNIGRLNFTQSFNNIYGPEYYSFNYGKVHFIVLNTVAPTKDGYKGAIADRQLTFIKNDLAKVDKSTLVVLLQHIPVYTIENLDELLILLRGSEHTLAVSGHRHILEQVFIPTRSGELHEVVAGAVCGLWWDGERDWRGIPVSLMGGGSPKGYYIFNFHGSAYKMDYKAFDHPKEKQINIWVHELERGDPGYQLPEGYQGSEVLANVFAGSEKTTVKMRVNDQEWRVMEKTNDPDPYVTRIRRLEALGIYPTHGQNKSYLKKEPSMHLWKAQLPIPELSPGSNKVEVRAWDKYGLDAYEVRFFQLTNH